MATAILARQESARQWQQCCSVVVVAWLLVVACALNNGIEENKVL